MKELFKSGASLFGKLIVINVMCLFLVISFTVIFTGLFTENVGYVATGTKEGSETSEELYTHFYSDGEDVLLKEYEAKGYTVSQTELRSEFTKKQNIACLTLTQVFCLVLMISFIYPSYWHKGTNDSNLVRFKHKSEDILKGLKSGLIAVTPSVLFLLFLSVVRIKFSTAFPVALYRFMNSSTYSFIFVLTDGKATFGEIGALNLVLMFLPLFIPVVVSALSYYLGYKNISIGDKILYKKNKTEKK